MRNVVQLCLAANNILLMHKRNQTFLLLALALAWKMADRFASRGYSLKNKLSDQMIKQLLNLVIAKYCDLSLSHHSIICLSLQLRQIIYWFARHWQITIVCLTSSNVNYFLTYPLGSDLSNMDSAVLILNNWDLSSQGAKKVSFTACHSGKL